MIVKETYKVDGMTCAACSAAVERVTSRLEGVSSVSVNLNMKKMQIEYDSDLVTKDKIFEKINKAGFQPSDDIEEKNVIIPIDGMECSACAIAVEKSIKKLDP